MTFVRLLSAGAWWVLTMVMVVPFFFVVGFFLFFFVATVSWLLYGGIDWIVCAAFSLEEMKR